MNVVMDAFRRYGNVWLYLEVELDQIALAIFRDALSRATPEMLAVLQERRQPGDRGPAYDHSDSHRRFEDGLYRGRFSQEQLKVMMVLAGTRRREEAIFRMATKREEEPPPRSPRSRDAWDDLLGVDN